VFVVSGAVPLELPPGTRAVSNPRWSEGQLSSLQAGVSAILATAPETPAVLVMTVDRPRIRLESVQALLAAWEQEPQCLWQPTYGGRSGHPVLYPATVLEALLALGPSKTARDLVRSDALEGRRRKLAVDDRGVVENVDTPEDFARLAQ
jgi:CTP:molybdopterin cytidylyltransferase MocA